MKKLAVVANSNDNVATAVTDLKKGQQVLVDVFHKEVKETILEDIPFGHKFALVDINKGENVVKYGETIGRATTDITKGFHVHVHNIESIRGRGDLEVESK